MKQDVDEAEQAIEYLNKQIQATSLTDMQNVFFRLITRADEDGDAGERVRRVFTEDTGSSRRAREAFKTKPTSDCGSWFSARGFLGVILVVGVSSWQKN